MIGDLKSSSVKPYLKVEDMPRAAVFEPKEEEDASGHASSGEGDSGSERALSAREIERRE